MHILAPVKVDVPVQLYCQLRLEFFYLEGILVHEKWCEDLQADVHTAEENYFGVDLEN